PADRAEITEEAKRKGRQRDDVRPAALAEHAGHGPGLRALVDVGPPHVQRLATPGAEEEQELDRASNNQAWSLLAVLKYGVGQAGRDLVERRPERSDLFVGEDALARALRADALEAGCRIALDQLFAQTPTERRADQGEDAIRSDGRLPRDLLQEGAELTPGDLACRLAPERRALDDRSERPPIVAVRRGASASVASVDVIADEHRHSQRLASLSLGHRRIMAERGVAQRLARELASVGQRQRRKRPESGSAQSSSNAVED